MASTTSANHPLLGKRKKRRDPNPNPLFSKWLTEWRDEAKEKGLKTEYIYSRALKSLRKFPLPLSSGKECKILQNFGDKICRMLDNRLAQHKQEQEQQSCSSESYPHVLPSSNSSSDILTAAVSYSESAFSNKAAVKSYTESVFSNKAALKSCSVPVHDVSDSSDDDIKDLFTRILVQKKSGCERDCQISNNNNNKNQTNTFSTVSFLSDADEGNNTIQLPALKVKRKIVDIRSDSIKSKTPIHVISDDSEDEEICGTNRVKAISFPEIHSGSADCEIANLPDVKGCQREMILTAPTSTRVAHISNDNDYILPMQRAQHRTGGKHRDYIPAYRSGPYAVLITLLKHSQDPDFQGFMTKAELCCAAQPLADKSFSVPDPGSHYTAWSSVSALIKKGFLSKESNPAKFRLTNEGYKLASRLVQAERVPVVDSPNSGVTKIILDKARDLQMADADIHCVQTSGILATSSEKDSVSGQWLNNCVAQEANFNDEDDDLDILPPLPSLATRLKSPLNPTSGTIATGLQYWYVTENDNLVTKKSQACVLVNDDFGMGFLVKVNYQHLLKTNINYKLDMSRRVGEDYVYAYLSDRDCLEEAPQLNSTPLAVSSKPQLPSKSSTIGSRPEHHISDSDSETESTVNVPPKFVTKATSHLCTLPSYAAPIKGLNSCKSSSFVAHQLSSTSQTSMDSSKSNESAPLIAPHQLNSTSQTSMDSCKSNEGAPLIAPHQLSSTSQTSMDSCKSNEGAPLIAPVSDFIMLPGSFEIVLCVDNREFYGGNSSSKTLLPDLIKNGVNCELRLLSIGDILWVAREKVAPCDSLRLTTEPPVRRELVLNYVIERKRMDDLVSSITKGRLKEQKFRLKQCGLQEKIILIESYGSMQNFSISEERIRQAISNTEIIDGFTIKQTRDSKETAAYLTLMTRYLQSYYQTKTLQSCGIQHLKESGIIYSVKDSHHMLMPFDHFNQAAVKSKPLTVRELFAKQLIQVWGISAEKAKAILERYPTPSSLFKAYANCITDKEKESLLVNVKFGKNLRNLGISISRQVALLYTSTQLT